MDLSITFDTVKSGWLISPKILSFSEDPFGLNDSADPDEMLPYAAFHLGLHCLQKYPFWSFQSAKRLIRYIL